METEPIPQEILKEPGTRFAQTSSWLRQHLDRVQPPDSVILVVTALIVGAGTGLGAVIFVRMLASINTIAAAMQARLGDILGLFVVMGLAGLIVGWIVARWASEAKGHGVPEVMEAIALRGGRIRPRVALVKVLASSITIGAGGSAGREGPIVQVGSALGSTIGQLLHFSTDRVTILVACGAAAGIAATFNAPISGSIFALEVILARFTSRYFGAVVISSVSASIVARALLSDQPAFTVPAYPLHHLGEIPIYILLGLLSAMVAVLFIRTLYRVEGLFDHWEVPLALKTMIGMLLTAGVALLLPGRGVLGPGLHLIGEAIAEDINLSVQMLLALLVLKLLATSFTLGSGNSGGVFAPSLFMGAALGGIVGSVGHSLWPSVVVDPGAYAIVGMAAVFSGAARAPITAVLIVFEMSNDYKLILPLMMATVLSTFLAEHLFAESIYTLKLKLKGINLQQGRDMDIMQGLLVREAMTDTPYVVEYTMPLDELGAFFQQTHSHSFPVVDENHHLKGMISIRDYEHALETHRDAVSHLKVADIATMGEILVAYEDEPMGDALQRIAVRDINKLPVVSRQEPGRVVGVIRRRDIIRAYNVAATRRRQDRASSSAHLEPEDEMTFVEMGVTVDSQAANQTLARLSAILPHDCVIVSVRRRGTLLIPHGDTTLRPGDRVTAFLRHTDEERLRDCVLGVPAGNAAQDQPAPP